jgi:hypothetical protein
LAPLPEASLASRRYAGIGATVAVLVLVVSTAGMVACAMLFLYL